MDVIWARALVGSSNFMRPGLTENVELNIQIQSGREVAELQEWFNHHWKDAKDVTEDVVKLISRHTHAYIPFNIYSKALHEFFRGHEITASEWEETYSKMFSQLDRYQKEAYWALMKIARQQGGAGRPGCRAGPPRPGRRPRARRTRVRQAGRRSGALAPPHRRRRRWPWRSGRRRRYR